MAGPTAQEALDAARAAQFDINKHEDVCAERYKNINASIAELKAIVKWAGGLIISLIITVLGWSLVQQLNANEAQKKWMADQIILLQQRAADSVPTQPSAPAALPPR